jgi:mono/diheme cytochrome c family protein
MYMKRILAYLGMAAIFAGNAASQAPTAGNATNGKAVFLKQGCYRCHGTDGQGGAGPKLAPHTIPAAALIAYVRKPSGQMPGYASAYVSDAELNDIRAYLASIPEPPKVKDIPLLNQ